MAYGIVHHFSGGTKEQYEASIAAVHPEDVLPEGQIHHAGRPVGGWLDRRGDPRLERELGAVPGRDVEPKNAGRDRTGLHVAPQETTFEVHSLQP